MVSGMILSRYVFALLNIRKGMAWAGRIHMLCAYWGFLLMSIHLGFHWNMIIAMTGKVVSKVPAGAVITLRVIAAESSFCILYILIFIDKIKEIKSL